MKFLSRNQWRESTGAASFTSPATPTGSARPAAAALPMPNFGRQIDGYQPYQGQKDCDPTPKPGVVEFRDLLKSTYGRNDLGISRPCSSGGQSEHKEGRALDYPFNANNAVQAAQATDLLNWLLATDRYGNTHALAQRLGIMYMIWSASSRTGGVAMR